MILSKQYIPAESDERADLGLDVLTGGLLKQAGGTFEDDCSMVLLRVR